MMSPDLSFPLSLSSTCPYGWGREGIITTHHSGQCVLSHFSHVQLFTTLWTVACQAPLPMGFFRQEYWSGLPCPSPGDRPNPGIEPVSCGIAGRFFTIEHREAHSGLYQPTNDLVGALRGRRIQIDTCAVS